MVVVLRHHNVVAAAPRVHENGVARVRATGVDAFGAGKGNSGCDDVDVFAAKQTAFAGVGVEPRYSDARCRYAKALQAAVCQLDGA